MDPKEVEMEDAGKLVEHEVMGDEECAGKDQIDVENVEDKQEESVGLVNTDPNEYKQDEEEKHTKTDANDIGQDEEEMQANAGLNEIGQDEDKTQANTGPNETGQGEEEMQANTGPNEIEQDKEEMQTNIGPNEIRQDKVEMQINIGPNEVGKDEEEMEANTDPNEVGQDKEEMQVNTGVIEIGQDEEEMQTNTGPNKIGQDKDELQANTGPNEVGQDEEEMQASTGPNEIGQDEEEMQANKIEQEAPVDEAHDSGKDGSAMGDDKVKDIKNEATYMDDDHDGSLKMSEINNGEYTGNEEHQELVAVAHSPDKAKDHSIGTLRNELEDTKMDEGYESGTQEDQERFMNNVEAVYREKGLEFKPPKFYGQPLNCLKLWRFVIKLGGYDRVTGSKLWRQIGESFHPPKTCTTVSYTFRQFYEKALLEYERHKVQIGELEFPLAAVYPDTPNVENETPGSGPGRARRDAAARAMQGWHAQRLVGLGEEKNSNNSQKREKSLKSIGSLKHKRPSEVEYSVKAARTETSRHYDRLVTTVADVGPPANWVKVNVLVTNDCYEVYALVPGLLREEVRVQSDPAGRVVITGQPEQPDNPWGITPFKKVITLPSRIDPLRTSAVVSLHGRLLVRVPFEQSNI